MTKRMKQSKDDLTPWKPDKIVVDGHNYGDNVWDQKFDEDAQSIQDLRDIQIYLQLLSRGMDIA